MANGRQFVLLDNNCLFNRVKLSLFLNGLLADGNVVVPRVMTALEPADLEASTLLLAQLYNRDRLEMPSDCPVFDPESALWAASYVFRVCQLILLRDINETEINSWLAPTGKLQTAEVVYSADLLLRFLPDLFQLGGGISPEDPLVDNLKQTAITWPFSSVGIDQVTVDSPAVVLEHPSLAHAYINRIIQRKDMKRLKGEREKDLLKEILGANQPVLWPGLELIDYDTR